MGRYDFYLNGDHNAICDVCGRKYKASMLRKRWDGAMVCREDWEPRHPQEYVKGVPDVQSVPWSRPEAPDVFVAVNWTQYPTEDLTNVYREPFVKDISKVVGLTIGNAGHNAINGVGINVKAINSSAMQTGVIADPAESLAMLDQLSIGRGIGYAESVGITSADSIGTSKALSESSAPTESASLSAHKNFSESLSLADTVAINDLDIYLENLTIAESVTVFLLQLRPLNRFALNAAQTN